jgi:hypothetical protein
MSDFDLTCICSCLVVVLCGGAYYVGYAHATMRMLDACKTVPELDAVRRYITEKM